ncbi:Uncharacterised protein [Shigella flexneri]|nr:Uncharacterised protein [Shigella flexneri]
MGNKVLFEVVDHGDQFFKRCFVAAMVHQQLLCAKHLRHFGQYGSTAVSNHVVRETPQHRVSSNTRKTVRTTALQTKLQFAEFSWLAFIVAHHVIQLMQMLDPGFDLIILLLADHEMNAFRIDIAQRFTECGNLVVFTAQTNHQHCARVRVAHHVLQHGAGVDVIVAQL